MKILCIGDSNTYGYDPRSYLGSRYPAEVRWTDRLAKGASGRYDYGTGDRPGDSAFDPAGGREVINCGVNGMTVPRGQTRYPGLIRMSEADLVIVMLGTNDLYSGLSAAQIAERMDAFLDTIQETGRPVLLISPPLFEYSEWIMDDDLVEESEKLGAAYRELAERKGCMFADSGEWNIEMSYDGVHFSPEGHAVFAEKLEEIMLTALSA